MNVQQVIQVLSEVTPGPISSAPAPAGTNSPAPDNKPMDENQVKTEFGTMLKDMSQRLKIQPEQMDSFSKLLQQELQNNMKMQPPAAAPTTP